MKLIRFTVALVFASTLIGCAREPGGVVTKSPDPVLVERQEKDRMFKSSDKSPLRDEDKVGFQGLPYYDIGPEWRLKVKLQRHPKPEKLRIATNTPEVREALRYGYFDFELQGQKCRLQVYRMTDETENGAAHLFLPFRDATSGRETYGGGRYIDLKENTSGIYELDFNRAYTPFCAFGKDYSCPLPPRENTLSVPIRAGEKNYPIQNERPAVKGQGSGMVTR